MAQPVMATLPALRDSFNQLKTRMDKAVLDFRNALDALAQGRLRLEDAWTRVEPLNRGSACFEELLQGSPVANPAFDVTPARLVTALITERGVCPASREGLLGLFPERRQRGAA